MPTCELFNPSPACVRMSALVTYLSMSHVASRSVIAVLSVEVREHAESIAFYSGESFERGRCQHRFFNSLMDTLYRLPAEQNVDMPC